MNEYVTAFNVAWCTMRQNPQTNSAKVCDLPVGSVLILQEIGDAFTKVVYRTTRDWVGYVPTNLLDVIETPHDSNVVKLHGQSPSLQDAAQYLVRNGKVWYNLCGEMCITALLDPEQDLDAFLTRWQAKSLSVYQRVFKGGLSATTSLKDLESMADACDAESLPVRSALPYFTPKRVKSWTKEGWGLIVGVKINGQGHLKADGKTLHWVAMLDVTPNGVLDGLVTYYNPYFNAVRQTGWTHFMDAMGIFYGLLVRKSV